MVVTRGADEGDRESVWPLVRELAMTFTPARTSFHRVWHELIAGHGSVVLVADCAGCGVCGYVLASTHQSFVANGAVAWVEELMVHRSHRRLGVGRGLMTHVERWSLQRGCAQVSLATRRAGSFYCELGYEESAGYYRKLLGDEAENPRLIMSQSESET